MILLVDNYDSFTYNLYDYVLQCGQECRVLRNDECTPGEIIRLAPKGIIFSPGPCTPAESGYMPELLRIFSSKIPVLGVCLGHQAIGEQFGAKLVKAQVPVHGKSSEIIHNRHEMFEGMPNPFKAMRYHSLILTGLERTILQVTALTPEGDVMAIAHPAFPIWGVQFHPESVLTPEGILLIRNWTQKVK